METNVVVGDQRMGGGRPLDENRRAPAGQGYMADLHVRAVYRQANVRAHAHARSPRDFDDGGAPGPARLRGAINRRTAVYQRGKRGADSDGVRHRPQNVETDRVSSWMRVSRIDRLS